MLHAGTFVGLVAHTKTSQRLHSARGAWGLRASCDHNALRFNGQAGGGVAGNSKGYSFGYGERIGLLVDARKKTVQMLRDGVRVEGALLQLDLKGFAFDGFRLAVDLGGLRGTTATLAMAELPPAPAAEAVDVLQCKVPLSHHPNTATIIKPEAGSGGIKAEPEARGSGRFARSTEQLVGGLDDPDRAAPSWSLVHTVLHSLLDAKQQALLMGKPLLRPNGHPTLSWNMTVDRSSLVRSFLQACGRASRKNLLCGGTVVNFKGEHGVDEGGLTRELFTLFRQRLLEPPEGDLQLFVGFVGEELCGEGAAGAEERAFVPRADDATQLLLSDRQAAPPLEDVAGDLAEILETQGIQTTEDLAAMEPETVSMLAMGSGVSEVDILVARGKAQEAVLSARSSAELSDEASREDRLDEFRQLGRALTVVFRQQYTLDQRFAGYVLSYLCADDALPLADRAAIGTTGTVGPTECTVEETLDEVQQVSSTTPMQNNSGWHQVHLLLVRLF